MKAGYLKEGFWPQCIDVFSDFGVSSNYFIDGEALLTHCFNDSLLDNIHGGQPVHVIYRFQHFVEMLVRRRAARFHVIFSKAAAECWKGSKQVVRTALITWLAATSDIAVNVIEHIWDDEFEQLTLLEQPAYLISTRDFNPEITEIDPKLKVLCEALILRTLNANQSVVLLDGIAFEGPKVTAWTLFERPADALSTALVAAALADCAGPLLSAGRNESTFSAVDVNAVAILGAEIPGRVKVACLAIRSLGDAKSPVDEDLRRTFVLHSVLLSHIPIADRCGALPATLPNTAAVSGYLPFLETLWEPLVVAVLALGNSESANAIASFCDLWDGRFMLRLLLAAQAVGDLGLETTVTAEAEVAFAAAGLKGPISPLISSSSTEKAACLAAQDEMTAIAVETSTFPEDSESLPRFRSDFLARVIPDVIGKYGGTVTLQDDSAAVNTNSEAAAAAKEATGAAADEDDEDSAPDDWDASSEDDGGDVDEAPAVSEGSSEPSTAVTATSTQGAGDDDTSAVRAARFSPPIAESWLNAETIDDEEDAYNTAINMRGQFFDGDALRGLTAMKKFIPQLRKRLRNKLSEKELEGNFKTMISELKESQQMSCARDLEDFFSKNRFAGGLEKLIVRKWMGKVQPQKSEQSTSGALRDYSKSLQDRIIQQEVIVEKDDSIVDDGRPTMSVTSSMISARSSVKKMIGVSAKRREDLDSVLKTVETATKRGKYADAWARLDDFLLDRLAKDAEQYRITDRAIKRLEERTADGKGQSGGKKGKSGKGKGGSKGKGGEEEFGMKELLAEYEAALGTIKEHRCQVDAMLARLKVTYTWWLEGYAQKTESSDLAEVQDAKDNEHWACGLVLEELFEVVRFATSKQFLTSALALELALILRKVGFPFEAGALSKQRQDGTIEDATVTAQNEATATKQLQETDYVVHRKGRTLADFQMACMGPLLTRPVGAPDSRVRRFKPDKWQRDLLDVVDTTEKWRKECKQLMKKRGGLSLTAASTQVKKDTGLTPQSAVVSAPTSSGKTFISFYVMEQVLREASQGNGVVIYVSPTKALVNQVEADLYARFEKSFGKKSQARTLHGVFTKEYRHNVDDCQVLITVPDCVELLLLHVLHTKFMARVRWIIFDEVHCISKGNGDIWERLLIMTRANFVALSATIGNPEDFSGWLSRVENAKGHELKLVRINERINDLSITVYDSSGEGEAVRKMDRIVPINPLGVLSVALIRGHGGIPNQTKLLPEHCWEIVNALIPAIEGLDDSQLTEYAGKLDLTTNSTAEAMSMRDAAEYEATVKAAVCRLVEVNEEIASSLIATVGTRAQSVMDLTETKIISEPFQYLEDNLMPCLLALDSAGSGSDENGSLKRLPAIVFHLSVRGCNRLVKRLTYTLKALQHAEEARSFCKILLGTSTCYQEKLMGTGQSSDIVSRIQATAVDETKLDDAELKKAVEMSKKTQEITMAEVREFMRIDRVTDWTQVVGAGPLALFRKIVKAKNKYYQSIVSKCTAENERREKEYQAEVDADRSGNERHTAPEMINFDHLLPEYIDQAFSFLPPGLGVTDDDLKEHLGRWFDPSDFKSQALQRGIGIHYAELPRKYKNAVERLFRLKKLKVVIATQTLALGINMPCKTVIIAGDQPDLDTLEYHQMIGRAGRRTFDKRGNVVFLGVPQRKICRLLSSNVADLVGNVLLTPTLAQQLILRYRASHSSEDREEVVAATRRLVQHPFFRMGSQGQDDNVQMMHQLLFCCDLLMDDHMKLYTPLPSGKDIEPTSLSSLLGHLYFMDAPSNFIFISLLQSGLIDNLVSSFSGEREDDIDARNKALLHILANIICTRPLPTQMRTPESGHDVKLSKLPTQFTEHLRRYNGHVLARYSSFVRRYAAVRGTEEHAGFGSANELPGCKPEFASVLAGTSKLAADVPENSALAFLRKSQIVTVARSAFVATSGHGDKFESLGDLLGSLREGIYLDKRLVPIYSGLDRPVNSYVFDFFEHGMRSPLSKDNGLRDSRLYDTLNKFCHAVRVIKESLDRRIGETDGAVERQIVFEAFETLERDYTAKFTKEFKFEY